MRDEVLWNKIRVGSHGVAALEPHLLQLARKQMPVGEADAALADALRRVTYLATVADAPVALPPMLYHMLTSSAKQLDKQPELMRRIKRLGFWDSAGYRVTQASYVLAFGAPPPVSAIWPPIRILQQMRALWWGFCGGTCLTVLGIALDQDVMTWAGMALTAGSFAGMFWIGRGFGLTKG
jgi:hypothetical protein